MASMSNTTTALPLTSASGMRLYRLELRNGGTCYRYAANQDSCVGGWNAQNASAGLSDRIARRLEVMYCTLVQADEIIDA